MMAFRAAMFSTLVWAIVACGGPQLQAGSLGIDAPLEQGLVGEVFELRARALSTDAARLDVSHQASWEVSDSTIARFVGAGLLRLTAPGSVTITARVDGERASVPLVVGVAQLSALQLVPGIDTLPVGARQQFILVASYSDGAQRDVTRAARWTFKGGLAAGDEAGMAIGQSAGGSVVRAVFQGRFIEARITVAPPTAAADPSVPADGQVLAPALEVADAQVVRLTTSVQALRLSPGQLAEVVVLGHFTDGSTVDLTAEATAQTTGAARVSFDGTWRVQGLTEGTDQVLFEARGLETVVPTQVSKQPVVELKISVNGVRATAYAVWADGLELDVTELARWTLETHSALRISDTAGSRGELSSPEPRDAVISASLGSFGARLIIVP